MEKPKPVPLDYSGPHAGSPDESTWPIGLYVGALVWAFVTMQVWGALTESYRAEAVARGRTQIPLLLCAAMRLAWARHRKEQGKDWIFYVVLLFLALPIWLLISQPLCALEHWLVGKPVIP